MFLVYFSWILLAPAFNWLEFFTVQTRATARRGWNDLNLLQWRCAMPWLVWLSCLCFYIVLCRAAARPPLASQSQSQISLCFITSPSQITRRSLRPSIYVSQARNFVITLHHFLLAEKSKRKVTTNHIECLLETPCDLSLHKPKYYLHTLVHWLCLEQT